MQRSARHWLTIILVLLVGAVCGLAIPPIIMQRSLRAEHDRHMKLTADIHTLGVELDQFKAANGAYPSTQQGLRSVAAARKDPWGNDYVYRCPGKLGPKGYDLFSPGPDHRADTVDDDWGEP